MHIVLTQLGLEYGKNLHVYIAGYAQLFTDQNSPAKIQYHNDHCRRLDSYNCHSARGATLNNMGIWFIWIQYEL